jgi:50S ribosome-binding GTPase
MFGDAYIRLRAQVGTALYSLVRLAQDCDAPAALVSELEELRGGLREPFLFVTLGDAESGKSSLLNALFGRDFTDAPARTEKITVYRHGTESRDEEFASGVVERQRPLLFLRDFTIVDTPAIGLRAEIGPPLASYVASADLLLVVFAAARPDADRTWTLLTRLNAMQLQRVIFVIDSSTGESLEEAAKNLRQIMLRRLGHPRPIFAVDTQRALAARIVGDRTSLAASGLGRLEEYIDRDVAEGLPRRAPLDLARVRAREILKEISGTSRDAVQSSARDVRLLRTMHQVIEERKDQSLRQMGGILWSLARTLEEAQTRGEASFRQHLSLVGLLRALQVWRSDLQANVEEKLRDTVWAEIDAALREIEKDRRSAWEQLEMERRRTMLEREQGQPPDFADLRERLRDDFDTVLGRHALDAGTDRHLHALFFLAAATLRVGLYSVAVAALVLGFTYFAEPSMFRTAVGGFVAISVATMAALALWQRRLLAEFRRFSTDRRLHEPLFARAQQLDEILAKSKAPPETSEPQESPPADQALADTR